MSTPKKEINFTQRDFELLAKAMSCTKEPMTIDYQKFAEAVPFKNANSAKASWHSIKKKIDALSEGAAMKGGSNGANEGSETGAAATPSKASGKKRKSDAIKTEGEDDDDAEAEGTPAKTPKKGRKSSTKVQGKASAATEEDGEKDEGQEMPSDDVKSEPKSVAQEDQPSNGDGEASAGAVKEEQADA